MSTLKVDTIQPNASDRVFVSNTLEVDGSQLLVNNALNVAGDASITGDLSAGTLESNGTITANGEVTGVSNLSCSTITATGSVTSGSISSGTGTFTGAVTSDGLNVFRPALAGTINVGVASPANYASYTFYAQGAGPGGNAPVDGLYWNISTAPPISYSTQTGISSATATWATTSNWRVLRLAHTAISNNYARHVQVMWQNDLGTYSVFTQPIFQWNTINLDIYGFQIGATPGGPKIVRLHYWIDFPNVYA